MHLATHHNAPTAPPMAYCYDSPDDDGEPDTGTESDWNDRYEDDIEQPEPPDICPGCKNDVHGCTCD